MFVGWIPIAIAAASAIGGVISAGSKRAQAKKQAELIDDMVEIEDEVYALNRDGRSWEEATRRFNNQREKFDLQTSRRQQLIAQRLSSLSDKTGQKQGRDNLTLQRRQNRIDAQASLQSLEQESEQVTNQAQQIGAQAGETLAGIPNVQTLTDQSLQGLAQMEAIQLARESVLASSFIQQDDLMETMRQNKQFAQTMLRLNTKAKQSDIRTRKQMSLIQQQSNSQLKQFDRALLRIGGKATNIARKADLMQQRALAANQKEGDQLTHQAKVAQLQLGQPSAPSLLPSIIGGAANIASAYYGTRSVSAPAYQSQPTAASAGSLASSGTSPGIASAGRFAGQASTGYSNPNSGLLSMNLDGGQYGGLS